jgi:cytoskeletal protein RodZ
MILLLVIAAIFLGLLAFFAWHMSRAWRARHREPATAFDLNLGDHVATTTNSTGRTSWR